MNGIALLASTRNCFALAIMEFSIRNSTPSIVTRGFSNPITTPLVVWMIEVPVRNPCSTSSRIIYFQYSSGMQRAEDDILPASGSTPVFMHS